MINSIGLPNKGLEGFLAEDLPQLAELPVPLIVSVMATSREDFARLSTASAARDEVAAIELNVSCPNVHSGLIVGEQPAETEALLEALRPLTEKPLIVKLTPNVADPAAVAVARRGGRGRRGLADQHAEGERDRPGHAAGPASAAGHGGLSGPAVRPIAVAQVRAVAAAVEIPVDRHGRDLPAAPTRANSSPPARPWWRSGPRASATRGPARGSPRSWNSSHASSAVCSRRPRPRVEVQMNFGANRPSSPCAPPTRGYTRRPHAGPPVKTSARGPREVARPEDGGLKRANDIRTARAKLKKDLKASRASIHAILLDPPEYVLTAKVFDMLLAVPKYGRVKTNRILNQCRISPSKTIGGLSERQRTELVSQLRR